jgi:hypothetical protein
LTNLEELYVFEPRVSDEGLKHLKGLTNLTRLVLAETQVTDAGLDNLKGLNKLQDLVVAKTKVTDAGVKDFEKALPKVRVITGNHLKSIMEKLERNPGTGRQP